MVRRIKEELIRFDKTPLFPERRSYTASYTLSDNELHLYDQVTTYVREEMNRVERLDQGDTGQRSGVITGKSDPNKTLCFKSELA